MKRFTPALRHNWLPARPALLLLFLLPLALLLTGCGVTKSIDDVINEIDKAKQTIAGESTAWRDELPKLVRDLGGLQSQVSADVKGIVSDTTNQVQDLATQTIQLTDAKAQDLIAQAGVEFRCNADFVKTGVTTQLQYIVDDLKFWKQNKRHQDSKPIHAVCWINPTVLSLSPSGNSWTIDPGNMSDPNVVRVFGYSFRPDALPVLELQNDHSQKIRNLNLTAAYVTRYQINLDFSGENFAGAAVGSRVVFRWPDQDDPNTINLTLRPPAKLKLRNPGFTPAQPRALLDSVTLKVEVWNDGGMRSGNYVVNWKPDPNDSRVLSASPIALNPGGYTQVYLSTYTYQRGGTIPSNVWLSTGDDSQTYNVTVAAPPPTPRPEQDLPGTPVTETTYGKYVGGFGQNKEYGGDCTPGYVRSYFQVITTGTRGVGNVGWTGNAPDGTALGWVDPNDAHNCRIRVHYSITASFPNTDANYVAVKVVIREKGE